MTAALDVADEVAVEETLPRFVVSDSALELIDVTFPADDPPDLLDTNRKGASILNAGLVEDESEWVALNSFNRPGRVDYLVSTFAERRSASDVRWTVTSAWTLLIDGSSMRVADQNVCEMPLVMLRALDGQFIVVTTTDWDTAIAAWVMTETGPRPFEDLGVLDCDEFIP